MADDILSRLMKGLFSAGASGSLPSSMSQYFGAGSSGSLPSSSSGYAGAGSAGSLTGSSSGYAGAGSSGSLPGSGSGYGAGSAGSLTGSSSLYGAGSGGSTSSSGSGSGGSLPSSTSTYAETKGPGTRAAWTGSRWMQDPHAANMFYVVIEGIEYGRFQECSGLSVTNEITEIKEGGLNSSVHKFINRSSSSEITLKRGFFNNPELFWWFEAAAADSWTPRKNGQIVVAAEKDRGSWYELARWNFFRAFPLKWEGPQLNASQGSLAMESLTLACEWIQLEVKFELEGGEWF